MASGGSYNLQQQKLHVSIKAMIDKCFDKNMKVEKMLHKRASPQLSMVVS